MSESFTFDPQYDTWANKVRGKCACCKEDIYNYQDTIALVDFKTHTEVALLHSNVICWEKWRSENLVNKR